MCCAVLTHVTYLVKTTSHDSAPPPLLLYKPEPHIAVDIPRGLPSLPPCLLSSPLSVSMSHKPSFSTDFSGFQPQFGRTYRPILVFQKETEERVKTSFMRGWDEKNNQERGTSAVWLNSPFSLIGRVGNTYPFCAPPLRFRSVHADECSWFDYLTVTGKFGGAQWRPNSNTSCNTKKGNKMLDILPQRFNLENFFWQWFIAFSLTCMCQNTCVYRFGANQ